MAHDLVVYTDQVRDVEAQLLPYAPKFEQLLPSSITPRMMITASMSNLMNNEYAAKIALQNPVSVAMSIMTSCTLVLIPDGVTGQGHLVPYGGKRPRISFMPGYQGYITLASRGAYSLDSYAVHSTDEFGETPSELCPVHHKVRHPLSKKDRGEVIGYYALAKHAAEPMRHHVMTMDDIYAVRDRVLDRLDEKWKRDNSLWTLDFPAMAKKTPIRHVGKKMPLKQMQLAAGIETLNEDAGRAAYLRGPNEAVIEGRIMEVDELAESSIPDWSAPHELKLVDANGIEHTGRVPHLWAARLVQTVGKLPEGKLQTFVNYNQEHIAAAERAGHVLQVRMVRDAIKARQAQFARGT